MKIEVWTFRFLGNEFDVPVHFHPSDGLFVATLPEDIAFKLTGQYYESKQTADGFKPLKARIKEMIEERERALLDKEISKKVIGYQVNLYGYFEYRVNGRKREFKGTGNRDLGVTLTYRVMNHIKIADREEFRDERGERIWIDNDEKVLDWTADREQFFANMVARLEAMILQLDRFFNKASKKKLLEAIDRGLPTALPAPPDQSTS